MSGESGHRTGRRPGPVVNSTVANANACANVSTRTAFALGRTGVFPRAFARLHPRRRSPGTGLAAQFVIAVGAALGLGFAYDPRAQEPEAAN